MSYVVVGTRVGDDWRIDVQGVGSATAPDLGSIETVARDVLRAHAVDDADVVDLQLLLPDFEADLDQRGVPAHPLGPIELISALIALVVVVGAIAFLLGRTLG